MSVCALKRAQLFAALSVPERDRIVPEGRRESLAVGLNKTMQAIAIAPLSLRYFRPVSVSQSVTVPSRPAQARRAVGAEHEA